MKYYTATEAIAELGLAIVPKELDQLTIAANFEELEKLNLGMDEDRHAKGEPCLVRLPLKKKAKKAKKIAETEEVDKPEEPAQPPTNPYKIDWSTSSLVVSLTPCSNGKTWVAIGVSGLPPLAVELAETTLPDLQGLVKRAKSQALKLQIQWNLHQKKSHEN